MKTAALLLGLIGVAGASPPLPDVSSVIQSTALDAARPYFIATHPRVSTTVRFPAEIGAPDGSAAVFTEDAARAGSAEYLVTWQNGDAYFTLTPLREARMANLNVPFRDHTYVLYFYAVDDPLKAVASVNFAEGAALTGSVSPSRSRATVPVTAAVTRSAEPPAREEKAATATRLVGLIDRLTLLHATPAGPALNALVEAMGVEVAISHDEYTAFHPAGHDAGGANDLVQDFGPAVSDAGLFQIVLLRVVRDRRLNCLGFACLFRNTSDQTLTLDVNSLGVRAGAAYLGQCLVDVAPGLKPGEQRAGYFIVQPPTANPLSVANPWKISVDLVSPRSNPGASLARGFTRIVPAP